MSSEIGVCVLSVILRTSIRAVVLLDWSTLAASGCALSEVVDSSFDTVRISMSVSTSLLDAGVSTNELESESRPTELDDTSS